MLSTFGILEENFGREFWKKSFDIFEGKIYGNKNKMVFTFGLIKTL
jgi:hypothetical protein